MNSSLQCFLRSAADLSSLGNGYHNTNYNSRRSDGAVDALDTTCKTRHDKLVQTAVAAKFVVELFTDTFCIVHPCVVGEFSWEEWDCGTTESRLGSLCFTMQSERGQRDRTMTLGVVNFLDNDPFSDDLHKKLAK